MGHDVVEFTPLIIRVIGTTAMPSELSARKCRGTRRKFGSLRATR